MTQKPKSPLFGYLHGFASSPQSKKGTHMEAAFKAHDLHLELADLNVPSFAKLTFSGALSAVDQMVDNAQAPQTPWCLYGSSMGGYIAARWAQLHPERVQRLVLLCPGFNLSARWPELVGAEDWQRWQAQGWLNIPDANEVPTPVHWEFVEDSRRHPAWPEVPCPTLIIHGTRDETVPIDLSRQYAATRPHVTLVEVDDDHSLVQSLDLVAQRSMAFLGLTDA